MNTYKTFSSAVTSEYKEKGSRFIGYAFNVESVDDAKTRLTEIKREHSKARHHCFAYRIGFDGTQHRAFDDGEPSGSAGKPILGQIDSFGLTNVLIVVVRYFGGVLLGASGLNQAYKSAARLALDSATIIEKEITFEYQLKFNADQLPGVMTLLKKNKINNTPLTFDESYSMKVFVPAAISNALVEQLEKQRIKVKRI